MTTIPDITPDDESPMWLRRCRNLDGVRAKVQAELDAIDREARRREQGTREVTGL